MTIAVWKVWRETHIVDEVAFGLGHRRQNLYTLVRRHEPMLLQVLVALAPDRRSTFEYILSDRLFHQLDEFSVKPGKGHEFVRIHNVAIRFVHVRIDTKRFRETSVALRYLALIRTVWGKGGPAPS
jgi:hypothetical protein